jgi:predicted acylesterase/phospholipase RssA
MSQTPERQCDVVMKGGITSGVVYPAALVELSRTYRLRGLGGTSAGAIGAAVGAAAELGRDRGGYERLAELPGQLGGGALGRLFQPQPRTAGLMRLMRAYLGAAPAGEPRSGPRAWGAVALTALLTFPVTSLLGLLVGAAAVGVGLGARGPAGWFLVVTGLLLLVIGWLVAVGVRVYRIATVGLPANLFGICRGLGTGSTPGFTDWLADAIDTSAGLTAAQRPLLFGDLWAGEVVRPASGDAPPPADPAVDLRMITTCLSYGRPYELPMAARTFFYDEATWSTLFPEHVMAALRAGSEPVVDGPGLTQSQWIDALASRHDPALRRLPPARALPVIVAARLSLSFPGLISAVPLWDLDFTSARTRAAIEAFREARRDGAPYPTEGVDFRAVWFSDGGLCSNFPVHFFDGALTTRPTFAIDLEPFPEGRGADPDDQRENIEYAHTNNDLLLPRFIRLPTCGLKALTGFAGLALGTARTWHDSSHLDFPGYRDRIVKVFQTPREGGLNLDMDERLIHGLGARGAEAARAMVDQFEGEHFAGSTATGWDNHRWVRFRALLACLPGWLGSYAAGRRVLGVDPADPPSYSFSTVAGRSLAADLADALDRAAAVAAGASEGALEDVTGRPHPEGVIRRVPRT